MTDETALPPFRPDDRCVRCGSPRASTIHDVESPNTEIRMGAHAFQVGRPTFELTDGELSLLALMLVDGITRIQTYENVTTGETVHTDRLLLKVIEMRHAACDFDGRVTVHPQGMKLAWEKRPEAT
jgi:hypothetical protein